jgi:choline dehydrogenase-like flavoprotein
MNELRYDFIVVGSGPSACVLVHQLAEKLNHSILVIERGDYNENWPDTSRMDKISQTFSTPEIILDEITMPQKGLDGKRVEIKIPNIVGGGSMVNGGVYIEGDATDYQDWPKGWQWDDFEESRRFLRSSIRPEKFPNTSLFKKITQRLITKGARKISDDDYHNGDINGVFRPNAFIRKKKLKRTGPYESFLKPTLLNRNNVQLMANTQVLRIMMKTELSGDMTATSVLVQSSKTGERRLIFCNNEIIVCAGPIESPRLLIKSGIGDPVYLKQMNIEKNISNRHVGLHLQDQSELIYTSILRHEPTICPDRGDPPMVSSLTLSHLQLFIVLSFFLYKFYIWGISILLYYFGSTIDTFQYVLIDHSIDFFLAILFFIVIHAVIDRFFMTKTMRAYRSEQILHYFERRPRGDKKDEIRLQLYISTGYSLIDAVHSMLFTHLTQTYPREYHRRWYEHLMYNIKIFLRYFTHWLFTDLFINYFIGSHTFAVLVTNGIPRFRDDDQGRVYLTTTDPKYLDDERDLDDIVRGVNLLRSITGSSPSLTQIELTPSLWRYKTGDKLRKQIKGQIRTTYHHTSTLRMTDNDDGVVLANDGLRVIGTTNIRASGAPVFRKCISTSNSVTCMMISYNLAKFMVNKFIS